MVEGLGSDGRPEGTSSSLPASGPDGLGAPRSCGGQGLPVPHKKLEIPPGTPGNSERARVVCSVGSREPHDASNCDGDVCVIIETPPRRTARRGGGSIVVLPGIPNVAGDDFDDRLEMELDALGAIPSVESGVETPDATDGSVDVVRIALASDLGRLGDVQALVLLVLEVVALTSPTSTSGSTSESSSSSESSSRPRASSTKARSSASNHPTSPSGTSTLATNTRIPSHVRR